MQKNIYSKIFLLIIISSIILLTGCGNSVSNTERQLFSNLEPKQSSKNTGELEKANKTLTIYSLEDSVLSNAVKKYSEQENTAEINWVAFDDHEKYISTLNTELMGGGGPDIFELHSELIINKEKNPYIEDLNGYIMTDKTFEFENYNNKIINAYNFNDQLYGMPLYARFMMIGLNSKFQDIGDRAILNKDTLSYSDLLTYYDALKQKDGYSLEVDFDVTRIIFTDDFVDYSTKKSYFDSPEFIKLLEMAKSAREVSREFNTSGGYDAKSKELEEHFKNKYLFYIIRPHFDYIYFMQRTEPYINYEYAPSQDTYINFKPMGNKKGEISLYNPAYSINSNSQNKELAWEFLKFAISDKAYEDMDYSYNFDFYVNKKTSEKSFKSALETYIKQYDPEYSRYPKGSYGSIELGEGHIDAINKAWENAEKLLNYNMKTGGTNIGIENSTEIIEAYINGHISAEKAAKDIDNNISIYLNE